MSTVQQIQEAITKLPLEERMTLLQWIHRQEETELPTDDPELLKVFGPTLMAIAYKLAAVRTPRRDLTESNTYKRLGYDPISLDEGLTATTQWLRQIGKVD